MSCPDNYTRRLYMGRNYSNKNLSDLELANIELYLNQKKGYTEIGIL